VTHLVYNYQKQLEKQVTLESTFQVPELNVGQGNKYHAPYRL